MSDEQAIVTGVANEAVVKDSKFGAVATRDVDGNSWRCQPNAKVEPAFARNCP